MLELIREDRPRNVGFGATVFPDGCYFSVWSPLASDVVVHLYTKNEIKLGAFALGQKKGGVWYGFIKGVKPGDCYALEALGDWAPEKGLYFKAGHFLVDPYATAINKPFVYNAELYANSNEGFIPKAIIGTDDFNWEGVPKVFRDRADVVLYEAHVRGMTMLKEDVPANLRGTYLGMCHESVIAHLKKLGVTTVQLMPVAASMSEPFLIERGLKNYWGYNPVCFMAPNPSYATDPKKAVVEFKTMVKTFHANGIAVILDVVFNHTAEAGIEGPVLCYKGLDAHAYYAYERNNDGSLNYQRFMNVTGCGNSFNGDHLISTTLIVDSLKYWLREMQVDGFRFDLAVTICRESHGQQMYYEFERNAGIFKALFANEDTQKALMIAEPWDPGYKGYQLGKFPRGWSEQNDKFRDLVRRFWRGDPGLLGEFATRLMGSRDVFLKGERSIKASINYVTYHDGFTLEDLVSYKSKHNELNLDNNNDGAGENFSTNCGEEGPSTNPEVIKKRWQLKRNLMATLIFAQGIPHILGGDELSKTQNGNNNAYCQDNDINYLHWNISIEQQHFMDYICLLSRTLASSRVFKEINLYDDNFYKYESDYIARWRKSDGRLMQDSDWTDPKVNHVMLYIGDRNSQGERWCFMVNNTDAEIMFRMPSIPANKYWLALVDSSTYNGIPSQYSNESGLESVCAPTSIKVLKMVDVEAPSSLVSEENMEMLGHSNILTRYTKGNIDFPI